MPLQQALTGDVFASIHEHDDERPVYDAAGQSVFAIERATTVAEQMREPKAGMRRAQRRFAPSTAGAAQRPIAAAEAPVRNTD